MEVRGVPFCGPGKHGDFKWMLRQPSYARWVFVFNDNVVDAGEEVPHDGAGSAAVRTEAFKYNQTSAPRVVGVPTGWCPSAGGFKIVDGQLESFAARAITLSIERLVVACLQFPDCVDVIAYSSDQRDPTNERLGSSIFTLAPSLCDFIVSRLRGVPSRVSTKDTKFTLERIDELEQPILAVGKLHQELCLSRNGGNKRALDHFVCMDEKLQASVAQARDLHFVGVTRSGKFLYERQVATIRPAAPQWNGPMRQMSIGAFASRRPSPFF